MDFEGGFTEATLPDVANLVLLKSKGPGLEKQVNLLLLSTTSQFVIMFGNYRI